MSLVTYADFQKPAPTAPSMKVHELATLRLHDEARPMPPGGTMSATDRELLEHWLSSGAPAESARAAACAEPVTPQETVSETTELIPLPGETCYEFRTHASTTSVDDVPYDVGSGEHYEHFYFKAPWPQGAVATRFGGKYDNVKVLHHWLLFSTEEDHPDGYHETAPLPTLIGVNAQMLAGWVVGGNNVTMPDDVALELPDPGTQLNIQWHYYNTTGEPQTDKSILQICTAPAGLRPHTASVSWLGTEDLNGTKYLGGAGMPPHQKSAFSGTCDPLRRGMSSSEPIHIVAWLPHMHRLGIHTKAIVNHKDGTQETVFDKPFDFNHQLVYMQSYELMPGDTLTANCEYNNTTDQGVPYGESADNEMCYLFTTAWPAHALETNAPSLIGATNTCW